MSITVNHNKSNYALFLEKEINYDRKYPLYEDDSEDELIEKWKQEPLNYLKQQKVWDYYPNTVLASVIELVHQFDERLEIKSLGDLYAMCAIPQNAIRRRKDIIYKKSDDEELYYTRLKLYMIEKKLNQMGIKMEEVYNDLLR